MQQIRLAAGARPGTRLFRNNTGVLPDRNGRPVSYGLCKGSPDLVGWVSVEITPEMVGRRLAVFAGIEVKTERGRVEVEQLNFIEQLQAAGGLAGVARSVEQAKEVLDAL